tara:strand:+ start:233 stop:574 length:342 start_codon:yes stop_codon:yes gene_type:complete
MVKQLECKDIKEYLKTDTKKVILDVRTQEEWDQFGKPDGEKLGLKIYFLTIKDENFLDDFKKLSINKDYEILSICKSGQRSQFVSELLEKENYKSVNISNGFDNWKSSDLPTL